MHNNMIPAQGEESCGSSSLHVVPLAKEVPRLDIC